MKDNSITYSWGENNLIVSLGNRTQPRIKILFWAEFIFTSGLATIFLIKSLPLTGSIINILAGLGSASIYSLAAYRFLSRMFYTEKLLLTPHTFNIIHKSPFVMKAREFKWDFMGPLHYIGQPKKTDHPLKGNCYDYFGFDTQEHLIQNLHNEGNLFFNYSGFPVQFGKGVYSWHAEELVNIMQLYIGTKLVLGPEWSLMVQEHEDYYGDN